VQVAGCRVQGAELDNNPYSHHPLPYTLHPISLDQWRAYRFMVLVLVVPHGEKIPYSGTDPESYIAEYT